MDAKERVELLGNSALAISFATEHEAQVLQQREAAVARKEQVLREVGAAIPGLEATLLATEAQLVSHDAAREAIVVGVRSAAHTLASTRQEADAEVASIDAFLLRTAPREIEEAIAWFRQRHLDAYQKPILTRELVGGTVNPFTLDRQVITQTNFAAATESVRYAMGAIRELENMRLAPVPDLERIAALKRGMPDATRPAHVETGRPLPRPVVPSMQEILQDRMRKAVTGLEVVVEKVSEGVERLQEREDGVVQTIKKILHNRGVGDD